MFRGGKQTFRISFEEIYLNIDILIKLIVLVVLCAVLNNLQTSFKQGNRGAGLLCLLHSIGVDPFSQL